jgi:hypothetical protein
LKRAADHAGVKASLAIPAFADRVLVDRTTFRRIVTELMTQVLADGTAGGQLSVSLSLSDPGTLAIDVGPSSGPTDRPAGRRAELPVQREKF